MVGQSGSGKSTMMNVLGCLDIPTRGTYLLDGTDVRELTDRELSHIRNKQIGFIFQQYNLIPTLTVLENVELPLILPGGERRRPVRHGPGGPDPGGAGEPGQTQAGRDVRRPAAAGGHRPGHRHQAPDHHGRRAHRRPGLPHRPGGVLRFLQALNKEGSTVILITHDNGIAATARRIIRLADGKIIEDREQEVDWL